MGAAGRFVALLLAQAIVIQGLQLQKIKKNPGILPIKQGQAAISHNKWTILKVLNLNLIHQDLEFNINRYANLNRHVALHFSNQNLSHEVSNIKTQTDHIMNCTIEKFKQIVPIKRIKRGIINPLGSLVKMLTGNLDNDDAVKYDKWISDIQNNQGVLNKRVTLIAETVKSLVNVSISANNAVIQIDKILWEIRKQFNDTKKAFTDTKLINAYNLFLHNFQMLYITIDEVENAIAFSKLRTLHQSLIETEELLEILIKVSKSNKLMYEVNLENLSKLEQCIEIKAYSKQNQITFVLEVPLVDRDMYTYYKVIPLPVTNSFNQTIFIIPKNPYLLAKGLKTVSLSTPCKEIDKEMFLCNKDVLQSTIKDSCIDALMKLSTNISSCIPVVAKTGKPKIEPIEDNQWILYSKTTILLTKMCNSEETIERLCGTYILILDDECRAKINNIVLQPFETLGDPVHFSKLPIVEFPEIPVPAPLPERKTYNLDETELSKLEHFASKYDETENISESGINTHSISVGTVIIYITIVIILFIYILYKIKIIYLRYRSPQSGNQPSDGFDLNGGGVMCPIQGRGPNIVVSS
ncbi:uncharacterized protein LOC126370862 [Pectinophora gossypiella]|uniref:uncharacterized protein LOC126370862 n=1 Tax=Pectinophora gossypiella TaxID=13191 RepID=UPI00214E25D4|nr:uncharacterized protein LOC126370862 [Pectinophora gossypiella]